MNKELFLVFVPGISWILFALGGTQISDKVSGWKGWRRFILPFVYLIAVWLGASWWQGLIAAAIAGVAYSLPYGSKTPYKMKWLVGCAYALISAPVGLSWWNLFTAIGFITLFILSNAKLTAKIFVWKIAEGFFGLLVGLEVAYLLAGYGHAW